MPRQGRPFRQTASGACPRYPVSGGSPDRLERSENAGPPEPEEEPRAEDRRSAHQQKFRSRNRIRQTNGSAPGGACTEKPGDQAAGDKEVTNMRREFGSYSPPPEEGW